MRPRPRSRLPLGILLAWLGTLLLGGGAFGRDRVPDDRAALIFYKAIQYDAHLVERAAGNARLVFVVMEGRSNERAESLAELFRETGRLARARDPQALGIEAIVLSLASPELDATLHAAQAVFLVSEGASVEAGLAHLAELAIQCQLPILSDDPALLAKCATLSVELVSEDGKARPRMSIQLERARAQGCRFDAKFLQLCEVIGR